MTFVVSLANKEETIITYLKNVLVHRQIFIKLHVLSVQFELV